MKPKSRRMTGGYRFKHFAGTPATNTKIAEIPNEVLVSLHQGWGAQVLPLVEKGQTVKAGQIIGEDPENPSNPVHATVNGTVEDIREITIGKDTVKAVAIKSDGSKNIEPFRTPSKDWKQLSAQDLEEALYKSGVAGLDSKGIPTRFGSSPLAAQDIKFLIVSAIEDDIYNISYEHVLSGEAFNKFFIGLEIVHTVLPDAQVCVVLGKEQNSLARQITERLSSCSWASVLSIDVKYPLGIDEVLIPTVLGKKPLVSTLKPQSDALVLKAQTMIHAHDAVVEGLAVVTRTIALAGTGLSQTGHVTVRIGSSLESVLSGKLKDNTRVVINSLMRGDAAQLSQPITRQTTVVAAVIEGTERTFMDFAMPGMSRDSYTNTFLAKIPLFKKDSTTNMHGEERPCVSCTFCDDICPAGIIPHLMYKHVSRDMVDETLLQLRIFGCVECNLCDYVCPSKLPVGRTICQGKKILIDQGYVTQEDSTSKA